MKFTFKTTKATGPYCSFYSDHHDIKLKRQKVGLIDEENRLDSGSFTIRLMVEKDDIMEDGNPNCSWKWIQLKKKSDSLQEAKDFLNEGIDEIMSRYKLHLSEIYLKKE